MLPNPLPYPMAYAWSGNTLTLTLGTTATPWPDGVSTAVYVTATVKSYPYVAPVGVINNQATLTVTKGSSLNWRSCRSPCRNRSRTSAAEIIDGGRPEEARRVHDYRRPAHHVAVDVTSAVVTDPLPADLQYVSSTALYAAAGWSTSYDAASHTVTWNLNAIPAGSNMNCDAAGLNCTAYTTLYVTVKVPPNAITSAVPPASTVYTNTASALLNYKDGTSATVA